MVIVSMKKLPVSCTCLSLVFLSLFFIFPAAAFPAALVQSASAISSYSSGTSIAKTFAVPTIKGDLIVAAVTWGTSGTPSCSDNRGNRYVNARVLYDSTNNQSWAVCYAMDIWGGVTSVSAAFPSANYRAIAIHEFAGIATTNPLDGSVGQVNNRGCTTVNCVTSTATSTSQAGDLIFGAVVDESGNMASITHGTSFIQAQNPVHANSLSLATEYAVQPAAGLTSSTFTFSRADSYINIVAAFKAAGPAVPDTTPPSVPSSLSATAVSASQINLTWTASTDNVGVAGYRIFRGGVQVGTSGSTSFSDTGLSPNTTYAYTVSAYDAAGNISASASASATTFAAPPVLSNGSPSGTLPAGTTTATLSLNTNEAATCRYATAPNTAYNAMTNIFTTTGGTMHSTAVSGLKSGVTYSYYVRCQNAAGIANTADFVITFAIADSGATPVPALVQSVSHPAMSTSAIGFLKVSLPNPSLAHNALLVGCTWGDASAKATVSDDKGNTWTKGPVAQDSPRFQSAQVFYALNAAAGTRLITITFSAPTSFVQCVASEWYNIAETNALDASGAAVTKSAGTIAAGNITTRTDGDLIFQYAFADDVDWSASPVAWTAGQGFTLITADGTSAAASQYQVQTTHGSVSPALSVSPGVFSGVTSTVALKAAAAGTPPAPGIRVKSIQVFNAPQYMSSVPQILELQVPATGNLIALAWNGGTTELPTSIASSPSNAWSHVPQSADNNGYSMWMWYAENASTSPTMAITITHATAPYFTTIAVYDITGAATSAFDTSASITGHFSAPSGIVTGPTVTPGTANGLVVGAIQEYSQTATAVSIGYFDSALTKEYQLLTLDQDGGYMHYYNPDTSAVHINWTYSDHEQGLDVGNWWSQAIAFKGAR